MLKIQNRLFINKFFLEYICSRTTRMKLDHPGASQCPPALVLVQLFENLVLFISRCLVTQAIHLKDWSDQLVHLDLCYSAVSICVEYVESHCSASPRSSPSCEETRSIGQTPKSLSFHYYSIIKNFNLLNGIKYQARQT